MTEKTKKHWVVLLALSFLAMSSLGLVINVGGIFLTPISRDLGILRGTISLHATLTQISSAIIALFVPKLMNTFHFKKIIFLGVLLASLSTILLGFSSQVWQFNLLGTIRGIGSGLFALVPLTLIINQWFSAKIGIATSIVMTAPGLVGVIFSPIFSAMIEQFNWRISYISLGILMILFAIFPLIYPFSLRPSDERLQPYGLQEKTDDEADKDSTKDRNQLKTTKILIIPLVLFMLTSFLISGITSFIQHLPGFAESIGYTAVLGGMLLSAAQVGNIVFKIIIGFLVDKFNAFKASLIILGITTLAVVALLFVQNEILLVLAAFLLGSIFSVSTVGLTTLTSHYFGYNNFGRIYPSVSFAKSLGIALLLSIYGYIYDFSGSFTPNLWVILGMIAFSAIVLFYNQRRTQRK